jgi:hypothetical protein
VLEESAGVVYEEEVAPAIFVHVELSDELCHCTEPTCPARVRVTLAPEQTVLAEEDIVPTAVPGSTATVLVVSTEVQPFSLT